MCWASLSLSPTASDFSTLSLPAKSTRWRQPLKMDPVANSFPWTWTVKTLQRNYSAVQRPLHNNHRISLELWYLWERLLLSFRAVAPTARFFWPILIKSRTSRVLETGTRLASGTLSPLSWELLRMSNVRNWLRKKLEESNVDNSIQLFIF